MTIQELLLQYESRLRELQNGLTQLRFLNGVAAAVFAVSAILFLILGLYAVRQQIFFLLPSLPVPLAAASAQRLRRYRQSRNRMSRLLRFYARAVQRVQGDWARSGADGSEFCDSDHPYARDLNVVGEGSLFELLCTVRTASGQRGLAQYLLTTPPLEETLSRQEAVRELSGRRELREEIAVLGRFEFFQSKWKTFAEWLDSPALPLSKPLRAVMLVTSTLLACLALIGFVTSLLSWSTLALWAAPILAFHAIVGLLFRSRVKRMLGVLHPVSVETQVLSKGCD